MRRKTMPRKRTKAERIAFLRKRLIVWNSQLRNDHALIAELQERIVHAERMRDETLRELDELK